METPLTILYTYSLRGNLDVLPRLYSFLRQLEAHYREAVVQVCSLDPAQAPGSVLLLDLGDSCAAEVWHCAVSGGRSTLVVLDGMGYDAARVEDAPAKRAKLGGGVQIALVDGDNPHEIEDVVITAGASRGGNATPPPRSPVASPPRLQGGARTPSVANVGGDSSDDSKSASNLGGFQIRPYGLQIVLTPADETRLDGSVLRLAAISGGQVGAAQLTQIVGRWSLATHEIHDLPRRILPSPTIAASVEFVISEARYAQQRKAHP